VKADTVAWLTLRYVTLRYIQDWCEYKIETVNVTAPVNISSLLDVNTTTALLQVNATVPVKPCKFHDTVAFFLFRFPVPVSLSV